MRSRRASCQLQPGHHPHFALATHPSCILQLKNVVLLRLATARSTASASPIWTMAHPSFVFRNFICGRTRKFSEYRRIGREKIKNDLCKRQKFLNSRAFSKPKILSLSASSAVPIIVPLNVNNAKGISDTVNPLPRYLSSPPISTCPHWQGLVPLTPWSINTDVCACRRGMQPREIYHQTIRNGHTQIINNFKGESIPTTIFPLFLIRKRTNDRQLP